MHPYENEEVAREQSIAEMKLLLYSWLLVVRISYEIMAYEKLTKG